MGQLTQRPPVRTGKCSIILVIDGRRYRVTPGEPTRRGARSGGCARAPARYGPDNSTRFARSTGTSIAPARTARSISPSANMPAPCRHGPGREECDAIDHDGLAEHTTLPPPQAAGADPRPVRRGGCGRGQGPDHATHATATHASAGTYSGRPGRRVRGRLAERGHLPR